MSDDSVNPQNPPADAVIPPPPPETPIPEGLIPPEPVIPPSTAVIPPPPADIPPADSVIPPPPPEAMLPSSRSSRRTPAIFEGEQPSAVADDWAQPSVAPEVPSSGGYRGLTAAIFAFLLLLLVAAIAVGIYLATTTSFTLPSFASSSQEPDEAPVVAAGEESEAPDSVVTSGTCGALCTQVSETVGASVASLDGTYEWQLTRPWSDVEADSSLSAEETVAAAYESQAGPLDFTVWRFADDAMAERAFADLSARQGEPTETTSVYENGSGTANTFEGDSSTTKMWVVTGDGSQPWVLQVQGAADDAVNLFYLALPI